MTHFLTPADPEIKDFSTPTREVKFKIDEDIFNAVPDIAGGLLIDFAVHAASLSEAELESQPQIFTAMFDLVLFDDSAKLFTERMRDKNRPITISQAMDVVNWLMEQYGMRPTQPSESSSDGSAPQVSTTNLTGTAPVEVSTSWDSPPPDSSTSSTQP